MARVLLTGGAGFIGSHLVDELLNRGDDVVVFDNFSSGTRENLAPFRGQIQVIEGDVGDFEALISATQGADYVLHEAAIASVQASIDDPRSVHAVVCTGTLNALTAARDCGVKRFVFASSSSVYGDSPELPKRETMPPDPKSPYALAKLGAESYARLFYELYGLPTVSLRYFNVFGPRQDPERALRRRYPNLHRSDFGGTDTSHSWRWKPVARFPVCGQCRLCQHARARRASQSLWKGLQYWYRSSDISN